MAGESAREEARRARARAATLARRAEMFEKGADGEAATAAMLAQLPPEWSAIHDVRWPTRRLANIDHIVVGPGGIFVIDSKNWSGRVTTECGHLRQNGRSREKEVAKCADASLAVAELAGPYADRVFAVLCFLTEEPISGWSRDVMLCSSTTLNHMLLSRPTVLRASESRDAWLRLDTQLRAAVIAEELRVVPGSRPPAAADRRKTRAAGRSRSSRRASQRRRNALRQFLFSLVVLAAFVGYGPQLAKAVGGVVAEHFARSITACDDAPAAGGAEREVQDKSKNGRDSATGPIKRREEASASARGEDC